MFRVFTIAVSLALPMITACSQASDEAERTEDHKKHNIEEAEVTEGNYREYPFKTITGEDTKLSDFEGKVVLVVNTASDCGFTPQYEELQELYQTYKDSGFVVIGFPANNFGGQEPGTNAEIHLFCRSQFGVTFPMMAKISVLGEDKHPLFKYLTEESHLPGEIEWNFTKFLLDRELNLVARYKSPAKPLSDEIVGKVKELL
jgi:glutathione peroxidase